MRCGSSPELLLSAPASERGKEYLFFEERGDDIMKYFSLIKLLDKGCNHTGNNSLEQICKVKLLVLSNRCPQ